MEEGRDMVPSAGRPGGREPGDTSESGLNAPDRPDTVVPAFDPVALRHRGDGWTPEKQMAFIEALADCGTVREAAARVGMSRYSAYNLRHRSDADAFRRAWDAALEIGAEELRSTAYERAVKGATKSYYYRGEKVGEDRVYDNRLLIALLGLAERRAEKVDNKSVLTNWDGWMRALKDGLPAPPLLPNGERARVWRDSKGEWRTNFPPPAGFDGPSCGQIGERNYGRACVDEEVATIEAGRMRRNREDMRQRDLYFAWLRKDSSPT